MFFKYLFVIIHIMFRNLAIILLFIILFIVAPAGVYLLSYTEISAVVTDEQKVKYNLPYPGILPDNPLYFVKSTRDKILEFITRDNIKKARLYLLFSDKKMSMALALEKKGKEKLAVQTVTQGEKEFAKLANILKSAKDQGSTPEGEFIMNIKLSNEKHSEIIQTLMKDVSTTESPNLNVVLKENEKIKKEMSKM